MIKPVIKVWGLPRESQEVFKLIFNDIVNTCRTILPDIVKDERDVVTLFPADQMDYGLGTEIVIEVMLHDDENEIGGAKISKLCSALMGTMHSIYPNASIQYSAMGRVEQALRL